MKIVYQGDLHFMDKSPGNRKDDFYTIQLEKYAQLRTFAREHDAVLLLGGDIFDTYRVSSKLINGVITVSWFTDVKTYTCLGQHDIPFHMSNLEDSPVGVLNKAGSLFVPPTGQPTRLASDTALHIANWECAPSKPARGRYNILLGHISVFDKIPHYWKGEGYTPATLKKRYPGYDLYLCGDIHDPLVDGNVVVSGSMTRLSINQKDYKPRAYLIDTDTGDIEPLFYTIKDDVFIIPEDTNTPEVDLSGLIEALKESAVGKVTYKRDCLALAGENDSVKEIIQEIFDELD